MKMSLLFLLIISLHHNIFAADKKFHIVGSFVNKTNSTSITIGNNTVAINDNKFELYGLVSKDEFVFVKTNNSYNWGIWLTFGEYKMELEEWLPKDKKSDLFYLRINKIAAPATAMKFVEFQQLEATLIKKEYNKQLAKDSINYYYTQQVFNYAKQVKKSALLDNLIDRLPDDIYTKILLQKIDSLNKNTILKPKATAVGLLLKGNQLENFKQKNTDGKEIELYTVKGRYILIDFWASWCGPCRRENANIARLYKKYKDKGFQIISISLDDKKNSWLNAIQQDKLEWINLSDLKAFKNAIALKYKIGKIPYNILLNEKYEIVATQISTGIIEQFLK